MSFFYICLYSCPANRFICTIFLDSTYIHWYTIFVLLFLTYFTLYDRLQVHPCLYKRPNFIPFWLINSPLCIYTTSSFPFICLWTFRLLPCPGYCKQCYNEQSGECLFELWFSYGICPVWNCWVIWWFWGFPGSSAACNAGDPGLIPGLGNSPGEGIGYPLQYSWASLEAQMVKKPLAMWKTWVWSLGWEDPLEEGMATHSSILAWRIPMDRGAWQATVYGVTKSQTWLGD